MTAPLPLGLITIVPTATEQVSSDPAEVIFERKRALHKFWKSHNATARATDDSTQIRCRDLFWRIWGDPRMSVALQDTTMMRLWYQRQRPFDLTPFELRISSSSSSTSRGSASYNTSPRDEPAASFTSRHSQDYDSISPSQLPEQASESSRTEAKRKGKAASSSRSADARPGVVRTTSGAKRGSGTVPSARGKVRPAMARRKSSQPAQSSEPPKSRKSILKSPRTSQEVHDSSDIRAALATQTAADPHTRTDLAERKISIFELPSASSWQSVESHDHHAQVVDSSQPQNDAQINVFAIDRDFRQRFQDQLRSSTNLDGMNRALRKTGSVVRFADDVEIPEGFKRPSITARQREKMPATSQFVIPVADTTPEDPTTDSSARSTPKRASAPAAWRPSGIERHDSIGSVAVGSEEDEEDYDPRDENGPGTKLPRVQSSLSLAIADLKRSQSQAEADACNSQAVTSPEIEEEQEALISGKKGKRPTPEEEKLLAMGRKDGVTRAGGVNLPKELTVKGPKKVDQRFEEPERTTF